MAISAIAQLALSAVPSAGKLIGAIAQNREAKKLQERGPDELAPEIRQALNRSRINANATVTPAYTAQKQLMDENVADATEQIKQSSNSAAEVIAGVNATAGQRGRALRELMTSEQAEQNRRENALTEMELFAGQERQRNRDIWQQDINRLLGARDANLYGAATSAAAGVAQVYSDPFRINTTPGTRTQMNAGTQDTYDSDGNLIGSKANSAFFANMMNDANQLSQGLFDESQSEYQAPLAAINKVNDRKRV